MRKLICILLSMVMFKAQSQNIAIELNNNWSFKKSTEKKWLPAKVPGSVYTDLIAQKIIPNPFYGTNNERLHWIDTSNWEYQHNFTCNDSLFASANIELIFDGIDTYADIYINNNLLHQSNNMFRQWLINIKPFIKKGKNNIHLYFHSAQKITDSIATSQLPIVRPDNSRVYARKAQYQFGWDWGPTFINAGIWKKVWIDAYDTISTREHLQIEKDIVHYTLPNDIKLIQQPDSFGVNFYFEKNGIPIYMKGANWIPASIFPSSLTRKDYAQLLMKAKQANMNMLRVWGGGIYESDDFYDLCDSLGIYVWQDFMFAGGMYPADSNMLSNIKSEIKYQIERLRHHPCIVLWCGNNEIAEAWQNWGWQKQYQMSNDATKIIWQEYQTLFNDSLQAWVNLFDGNRPYISTSPKIGWGHLESFKEGDSHYWGLWWGLEDWEAFKTKTGRFVSEYGMQSMSDFKTIQTYADSSQQFLYSPSILSHQKANEGFKKLNHYLTRYFIDSARLSTLSLKDYSYITQCLQAFVLNNVIVTHRKQQPRNMGSLLWQLNDCWPVTSWSIVDFLGTPKAAWYAVKRAYAENSDSQIETIDKEKLKRNQPKFSIKIIGKNNISVTASCDAQYVYISSASSTLKLSDNFFNIKKGESKIITVENMTITSAWLKKLSVYSLNAFLLDKAG